ncbi:MAG: exopolysaccharide biosynthesis protein [Acidobacteria bacterium]|nr:exopolysaccharide biosynthesis protein [Acidobacteriota bacterium]
MIDIHSHVLWGLDDGARTLEQSEAMLRMAAAHGTTDIVATPHADLQFTFQPVLIDERRKELQERLGETIRIHTGCDFHLKLDNIQDALAHPAKYSVNGRGWLLVEFSDLMIFPNTEEIFAQLENAGMRVIVTHPERNWLLRQKPERLEAWVHQGAFLQVTGQSLLGFFGSDVRKFSESLIEKGWVHFLASDAHDTKRRPPVLDQTWKRVSDRYGADYAEALLKIHPQAVIDGYKIESGPLDPPEKRRKWLGLF